jgi:hypothetical protein
MKGVSMWKQGKKPAQQATTVAAEPVAPPPAPAKPTIWRVKKAKSVAMYGRFTTIAEGQLVSVKSHGEDGILRMIEQGVELEEVG